MSFESRFTCDDPEADPLCDECDVSPCEEDCEEKKTRDEANLKAILELERKRGPMHEDRGIDEFFERVI